MQFPLPATSAETCSAARTECSPIGPGSHTTSCRHYGPDDRLIAVELKTPNGRVALARRFEADGSQTSRVSNIDGSGSLMDVHANGAIERFRILPNGERIPIV